jgi:molecular chaperone GrpE
LTVARPEDKEQTPTNQSWDIRLDDWLPPDGAPSSSPAPPRSPSQGSPVGHPSASSVSASELEQAFEQTMEALREAELALADERDRGLRNMADFENYKKRMARERRETQTSAKAELIQRILPVVDNLDRALSMAAGSGDEGGLAEGVSMVRDQLLRILAGEGLEAMDAAGQPFDPTRHDAVMTMPSDGVPDGHVLQELETGYVLGERVLRPAKVIVSAGAAE